MNDRRDELLVEPQWLLEHLQAPGVRILDCTTYMVAQPVGASKIVSGRPDYDAGHVPGAQHVDMVEHMSAASAPFPYTLPSAGEIERVLGGLGIGNEDRIIVYGRGHIPTVTRVWYVLHALGHRRVAILNGGFERWQREGFPVTAEVPRFPPTAYKAHPLPAKVAGFTEVQAAVGNADTVLVNALGRDQFAGAGGAHYGRPGRIPHSVTVPARELANQETKVFESNAAMQALFEQTGALGVPRVIAYCGGGIAASVAAFALELLGHPNWALYDNSLLEWSTRPDTEMATGCHPPVVADRPRR